MRILIVSTYFPPHVGGVEVVAQHQAGVLARAGHDVVVATSRWDPAEAPLEHRHGYRIRRLPVTNVIERKFGIPYPIAYPSHWARMWELVRWSDVVHLHDVLYQPPQIAALMAVPAGRPLYATQHVGPMNHPHPVVRAVERLVGTLAGRSIYKRVRRVVSYNPMVDAHLDALGVPDHKVVRGTIGVDTARYTPSLQGAMSDRPLVLFVGRMVDKKGYRHVLRAAGPQWHIVLAGSGHPAEPLPDGVTFLGPVTPDRLLTLYRLAAVFVLPSDGEVFPIAAREAMACGLPVVLTDSPLYDRYAVDRALMRLVAAEPDAVRRAIAEIVTDERVRLSMGAYSRRFAEKHFDATAAESELASLYGGGPTWS